MKIDRYKQRIFFILVFILQGYEKRWYVDREKLAHYLFRARTKILRYPDGPNDLSGYQGRF